MHNSFKALFIVVFALSLSACATINPNASTANEIRYAPAIDTTYDEVSNNITDSIGINVRWGGEIIRSKKVGDKTELTVFSHPLSNDGRPVPWSDKEFSNGRFIVEVDDYDHSLIRKYLTIFGTVPGEKTLTNGPKSIVVPVITAIESKEWLPEASNDKRGIAYYSLGHGSRHFSRFGRFGNRSFSRFDRNYYGHGFRSGSRFGSRGFFGRRGFH